MPSTQADVIDGVSTSLAIKAPVRAALSGNDTLSGLAARATVNDGSVVPLDGERWLVPNQTNPTRNGIYIARAGLWVRSVDFDGARDATKGTRVFTYAGHEWALTTNNPVTIGTSNLTWTQNVIPPVTITGTPSSYWLDVRDYGASESKTAAQNGDALQACILAAQIFNALNGHGYLSGIVMQGNLTVDASRLAYTAGHSRINEIIYSGHNLSLEFLVLQVGGMITLSNAPAVVGGYAYAANAFYVPQGWRLIGGSAGSSNQFMNGSATEIIGTLGYSGVNNMTRDVHVTGQTRLAKVNGPGQVAYLQFENFGCQTSDPTVPPLYVADGLEVYFDDYVFSVLGATPSQAISLNSVSTGTGLIYFNKGVIAGGNVTITDHGGPGNGIGSIEFTKVTSENCTQAFLFDINAGNTPNGDDNYTFEDVTIADNQAPSTQMLKISSAICGPVTCVRARPGFDASLTKISRLTVDGKDAFDPNNIDFLMSLWRQTYRLEAGDLDTSMSSVVGHDVGAGYASPDYKPLGGWGVGAGWVGSAGSGFRGSFGYSQNVAAAGSAYVIQQDFAMPSLAMGDVVIVGCWVKSQSASLFLPDVTINLLTGAGAQTDAFSGTTTATGSPILKRVGYPGWFYVYAAFKASGVLVTPSLRGALAHLQATAALKMSNPQLVVATGDLTRWEVHELAMANMRFPRLSAKTKYISHPDGCQMIEMLNLGDLGGDPAVLEDGDVWRNGANIKARVGGVTKTFTLT